MAKKKVEAKEQLFAKNALANKKATLQDTEADQKKVKQTSKRGRPPKSKADKEAIKIINLRIHEDILAKVDKHLKSTLQPSRNQFIINAMLEQVKREVAE